MPGASWMTFPWVRELKFTKKYWQCLVRVLEICWRCIWFTSLRWRTGVVFLWDRNPNRTWSQWEEEQKEHPWNDGFGGVVVTHSFRPAGLGTERRVKLTHGGFYGCGTIHHPSISIYRPPKQKFRQIKLLFDVYIDTIICAHLQIHILPKYLTACTWSHGPLNLEIIAGIFIFRIQVGRIGLCTVQCTVQCIIVQFCSYVILYT